VATVYKRSQDKGKRRSCWYVGYTDAQGKRMTVKGFSDKAESERLAARLEEESRLIKHGLKTPEEELTRTANSRSLLDLVTEFRTHLAAAASRGSRLTRPTRV
jgi:hypothetical protein